MALVRNVKWNNYLLPFSANDYIPYNSTNTSLTDNGNGVVTHTWLKAGNGYNYSTKLKYPDYGINYYAGHVYYLCYWVNISAPNISLGAEFADGVENAGVIPANTWTKVAMMRTCQAYKYTVVYLANSRDWNNTPPVGTTCQMKCPLLVDLTQMFGAGLEPATIADFEAICASNGINLEEQQAYDPTGTDMVWIIPGEPGANLMESRRNIMLQSGAVIPPAYQKVDWLQTYGYNSVIDTGVFGNNDKLLFDMDYMPLVRVNYAALFGEADGNRTRFGWSAALPGGSVATNKMNIGTFNRVSTNNYQCVVSGRTDFIGEKINLRIAKGYIRAKAGDFLATYNPSNYGSGTPTTGNVYIGCNGASTAGSTTYDSYQGRFYKFKIYDNSILIRNYIPVYRKSDNKAGFWDTVNSTFNPSIGSVDFTAGNDS